MNNASLKDTIEGLQSVRAVARDSGLPGEKIWCGGFFYQTDEIWREKPLLIYENAKRYILEKPAVAPIIEDDRPHILGPNFIGDSTDLAIIFDYEKPLQKSLAKARGYSCNKVATAVFLSGLLEHIAISFGSTHSAFTDLIADLNIPPIDPPVFGIVDP